MEGAGDRETLMATLPVDDMDLDDAALWAVIDSAAAASYSSSTTTITTNTNTNSNCRFRKPLNQKDPSLRSPPQILNPSSPSPLFPYHKVFRTPRQHTLKDSLSFPRDSIKNWDGNHRPQKISRSCISETSETSPNLLLVKHLPVTPVYSSPQSGKFSIKELSPYTENTSPQIEYMPSQDKENSTHCLSGQFPTVSLFKDYQDAAMAILEKSDYTMISGHPFIKKSGWRKLAFYFNVSFEIKDKSIEFDENHNVQRAEFVVRAYMQGGRFSDGWGSCERREKRFMKPNNDIPSTAETRAKNKACQDLLGIGEYRSSVRHNHSS